MQSTPESVQYRLACYAPATTRITNKTPENFRFAHCGLEWDARCLDFHQTERPVRTASKAQVRQPLPEFRWTLARE